MKIKKIRYFLIYATLIFQTVYAIDFSKRIFEGAWRVSKWCRDDALLQCQEVNHSGNDDDFMLYEIRQQGNLICGFHYATGSRHRRIDEGDLAGNLPSVYGHANENNAAIKIRSALTGNEGEATLTYKDGQLIWKMTKKPDGENWFPNSAILKRELNEPKSSRALTCNE